MSCFPDDHPIELLRGARKLEPSKVRRALVSRVKWLVQRIEQFPPPRPGEPRHPMVDELAAIIQAMEVFDISIPKPRDAPEESAQCPNATSHSCGK